MSSIKHPELAPLGRKKIDWVRGFMPVLSALDTIKADALAFIGDADTAKKAVLVFDEMLTNIVMYSGAKSTWYFRTVTDGELFIGLCDDGMEFDPTSYRPAEKDPLDFDSGGMGLIMVSQTVREWEYRRENGRNVILLKI